MSTDPAIRFDAITHAFARTDALRGITLDVPAGATLGLIGPNGAGKSTLLRILVGLLKPTQGRTTMLGLSTLEQPVAAKRLLGYVPDRPIVYGWMTPRQALDFAARLHTHAGQSRWDHALVADLAARLELPMNTRVRSISKGNAAKLSLLLALGHDPDILILDEPTDGLDPVAREDVLAAMLDANAARLEQQRPRTTIISSHALTEVSRLADHIAFLDRGELRLAGRTDDILNSVARLRITLDTHAAQPSMALPPGCIAQRRQGREWTLIIRGDPAPALASLQHAGNGHPPPSLAPERLTLDELFRELVRGRLEGRAATPQESI